MSLSKNITLLYFLYLITTFVIYTQNTTQNSQSVADSTQQLAQQIQQTQTDAQNDAQLAQTQISRIFTAFNDYGAGADQYPTTSINSNYVDALYGPSGLNIDSLNPGLLSYIKQLYFYLEYCAKLDKLAQILTALEDPKFSNISYQAILEDPAQNTWGAVIKQMGSWDPSPYTQEAWDNVSTAIQETFNAEKKDLNQFWQQITQTSFWRDIKVNNQDIQNSLFWQDFIKICIANIADSIPQMLASKKVSAQKLFYSIPSLEVSYYVANFAQERYSSEAVQLSLLLNERSNNRFVAQCTDTQWQSSYKTDATEFENLIEEFKNAPSSIYQTYTAGMTNNIDKTNAVVDAPTKQELCLFSMLSIVNHFVSTLFDADHLEHTMSVLAQIKTLPTPSILPFELDDKIYLEDFNNVHAELSSAVQVQTSSTSTSSSNQTATNTQFLVPQSIFTEAIKNISSSFKSTIKAAKATAKDAKNAAIDEAKVFYFNTGLYAASNALGLSHIDATRAAQLSTMYSDFLNRDLKQFDTDVTKTISNALETTLKDFIIAITNDPHLAISAEGFIDAASDAIGTIIGTALTDVFEVFRLTGDIITPLVGLILMTTGGTGPQWKALTIELGMAIWNTVVITAKGAWGTIMDISKIIALIIKEITNVIIDAGAGIESIFHGTYASDQQDWNAHRRLIASIVAITVLAATAVYSAPAAIGGRIVLGTLNLFNAFTMITQGVQEDEKAAYTQEETQTYFDNSNAYIDQQEILYDVTTQESIEEITDEFNDEIINQNIGLGFTQDFYATIVNQIGCQQAYVLGDWQSQLLATDTDGIVFADIGKPFGYLTGWNDLNPSQGLSLYEPSRNCYAQEIAQLPATVTGADGTISSKFWFLQSISKDMNINPASTIVFEAKIKPIYTLHSFYMGIGIGGFPLDPNNIQNERIGNTDRYSNAKFFVIGQDSMNQQTFVGVYEHESPIQEDGWLKKIPLTTNIESGKWYHLRMTLSGSNLNVQLWPENSPNTQTNSSLTITPLATADQLDHSTCPARTKTTPTPITQVPLTIVYSGVSVEWDIITPESAKGPDDRTRLTKPLAKVLGSTAKITELERETNELATFNQLKSPPFGNTKWQLVPVSQFELIKNNFVYTTQNTPKAQNQDGLGSALDYVVFAQITNPQDLNTLHDIGCAPNKPLISQSDTYTLVSLITGDVYDSTGKSLGTSLGTYSTYKTTHPTLAPSISQAIDTLNSDYINKNYMSPCSLGSSPNIFKFTPTSADDIKRGQFIYKTVYTIDKQHADTTTVTDYVLLCTLPKLDTNTTASFNKPTKSQIPSNIGLMCDSKNPEPNGFVSLLDYAVYNIDISNPTTQVLNTTSGSIAAPYQEKNGAFSTTILNTISTTGLASIAKTAATAAARKSAPPQPTQDASTSTQQTSVSASQIAPPAPTISTTSSDDTSQAAPIASLNTQQQNAASDDDWSW